MEITRFSRPRPTGQSQGSMLSSGELPQVYLKPGQWFCGQKPTLVATLLGSCVTVTMHHPVRRVGSICHATLPEPRCDFRCASCGVMKFQFVTCCVRQMVAKFEANGMVREELVVKLFGGADVLSTGADGVVSKSVGQMNVEMAERMIRLERLRLVASDVRGVRGRKIYFWTETGEVLLRRVKELPGVERARGPESPSRRESLPGDRASPFMRPVGPYHS